MTIEENRNIQKVLAQIAKQRRSERRGFGFALAVIGFAAMVLLRLPWRSFRPGRCHPVLGKPGLKR